MIIEIPRTTRAAGTPWTARATGPRAGRATAAPGRQRLGLGRVRAQAGGRANRLSTVTGLTTWATRLTAGGGITTSSPATPRTSRTGIAGRGARWAQGLGAIGRSRRVRHIAPPLPLISPPSRRRGPLPGGRRGTLLGGRYGREMPTGRDGPHGGGVFEGGLATPWRTAQVRARLGDPSGCGRLAP
ncbi:hypothetical protein [Acrocarpospora macrocephala]|uniref:hypothetical protein n=1 Tax=Acrocarpospora macrocephala TaxID=150177 RepID=UPI0014780FD8|nr:hypothetical protein [Acrocarpospora macrocephala]